MRKYFTILAAGMHAAIVLSGCGIEQTVSEVTIEAGSEFVFEASDFFDVDEDEASAFEADLSDLDTDNIGSYEVTVIYKKDIYTITVNVEDTTDPVISASPTVLFANTLKAAYSIEEAEYEDVTDCVIDAYLSEMTAELSPMEDEELEALLEEAAADADFEALLADDAQLLYSSAEDTEGEDAEDEDTEAEDGSEDAENADDTSSQSNQADEDPADADSSDDTSDEGSAEDEDTLEEGIYLGIIAVTDEGGNIAYEAYLIVYDTTAPAVSGLSDETIEQEDIEEEPEISMDEATVTDNMDGDIDLSEVETSFEETEDGSHIYTLTLTCTDRAGNTMEESFTYTVIEEEESSSSSGSSSSESSSSGSSSSGSSSSENSSSGSSSSGSSSSGSSSSGSSSSGSSSSESSSSGSSSSGSSSSGSSSSGSTSSESSSSSSDSSAAGYNTSYAQQVLTLINEQRAANGLSALTMNSAAQSAANVRAKELTTAFSHTRPDGTICLTALDEAGVSYSAAGENIACGQSSPSSVVNAWMNSSVHKDNILSSSYTQIGISCWYDGSTYYWVQLFIG